LTNLFLSGGEDEEISWRLQQGQGIAKVAASSFHPSQLPGNLSSPLKNAASIGIPSPASEGRKEAS
jgi:hypothetical protein